MSFKVIIAGSRSFSNYDLLCRKCDKILSNKKHDEICIISGTANGADRLGERYAKDHGYQLIQMPALWEKYGKSAGYKRNETMAVIADAVIAFWDGKSKGTAHMINLAKEKGIPVRVIRFNQTL